MFSKLRNRKTYSENKHKEIKIMKANALLIDPWHEMVEEVYYSPSIPGSAEKLRDLLESNGYRCGFETLYGHDDKSCLYVMSDIKNILTGEEAHSLGEFWWSMLGKPEASIKPQPLVQIFGKAIYQRMSSGFRPRTLKLDISADELGQRLFMNYGKDMSWLGETRAIINK